MLIMNGASLVAYWSLIGETLFVCICALLRVSACVCVLACMHVYLIALRAAMQKICVSEHITVIAKWQCIIDTRVKGMAMFSPYSLKCICIYI